MGKAGKISPGSTIFQFSYRRIWTNKSILKWETAFWTILAIYLGFRVSNYTWWLDGIAFWCFPYYIMMLTSPFVIAWMVRRGYSSKGSMEDLVSITTITPFTFVFSQWCAIALSWLRLYLPMILLFIVTHYITFRFWWPDSVDMWKQSALTHLVSAPYKGPTYILYSGQGWHVWEFITAFVLGQMAGWIMLPISWGVWLESRYRMLARYYMVAFVSYLLIPIALYLINRQLLIIIYANNLRVFGNESRLEYWYVLIGFGGIILSLILILLASFVTGRRQT